MLNPAVHNLHMNALQCPFKCVIIDDLVEKDSRHERHLNMAVGMFVGGWGAIGLKGGTGRRLGGGGGDISSVLDDVDCDKFVSVTNCGGGGPKINLV